MKIVTVTAMVVAINLVGFVQAQTAEPPANAASGTQVLATFADGVLTEADAEALLGPRLVRARQELFDVLSEGLKDSAFKVVQEREASKVGITVEELYSRNVAEKAGEPAMEEVEELMEQYRGQLPADDEAARREVVDFLKEQLVRSREQEWRRELLAAAAFRLVLEPPRMNVSPDPGDPVVGPPDAPVTIVEFSDFQCPFCARVQPALQKVRETYGSKVRLAFKHMPLPMHQDARYAAEASLCGNAQDRFWALHDWFFANQEGISPEAVGKAVVEAGIDPEKYETCMEGAEFARKVDADVALSETLGIQGAPFFLVNGRILEGSQPFEAFRDVIDDELERTGVRPAGGAS